MKARSDSGSGLPGVLFVLRAPPGPVLPRVSVLSARGSNSSAELGIELGTIAEEWLADLGGSPYDPPSPEGGPTRARSRRAAAFYERAKSSLLGEEEGALVFGDCRNCLLLSEWLGSLECAVAVLVVLERPETAASRLLAEEGMALPDGLSLWERYYRSGLTSSEKLPTFVSAETTSSEVVERFGEFLSEALGVRGDREDLADLLGSAGTAGPLPTGLPMLAGQQRLYELLSSLEGPHSSLGGFELPPESPWVSRLLEARGELGRVTRAAEWLAGNLEELVASRLAAGRPAQGGYPLDAAQDVASYRAWLTKRGEPLSPVPAERKRMRRAAAPYFSVVLSGDDGPLLARSIASALGQELEEIELLVLDGRRVSSELGELADDVRVRLLSSDEHEEVFSRPAGTAPGFVVLLEAGDQLTPDALSRFRALLAKSPDCRLAYGDEDRLDRDGLRAAPCFKADWSPELLLSAPYLGSPLVVERELFSELDLEALLERPSLSYEVALRAGERIEGTEVRHLSRIVCHRPFAPDLSPARLDGLAAAARAALERRGEEARVSPEHRLAGGLRINRRATGRHLVSAIIPFRDEASLLASCYRAFVTSPGPVDFELVLVDNGSSQPETEVVLEELGRDRRVRVLEHPGAFNWSTINNEAAGLSLGDILLFLNNDVEARSPGWLAQLVAQAERAPIGAVGARLLYPDGSLQHGGMAVGTGYGALHTQQGLPGREPGYLGGAVLTRNCSSVTGACLVSRREVFEAVGGFDESLPTAFGDVDYCLKVREGGWRVVYDAVAELVHHESKSRGRSGDAPGAEEFRRRWARLLEAGDPYYNENLSRFDPYCRLPGEDEEEKWERFRSMLREP